MNVSDIWRRNFLVLVGFVILFQVTQVLALEFFPVSKTNLK
jgi:ATP-binding cassette, subfamily G (WHITE), member 2, SNQ2